MSVLERCLSYKESNKGNKQRQGPTLGVRLIEVSVMRESTVIVFFFFIQKNSWRKNIAKTCLTPLMLSSSSIVHGLLSSAYIIQLAH